MRVFLSSAVLTAALVLAGLTAIDSFQSASAACCEPNVLNTIHCGPTHGPCLNDCNIKNACSPSGGTEVKYDCCVQWFEIHDVEEICGTAVGSDCDRTCALQPGQAVGDRWPFASCCNVGSATPATGIGAVQVVDFGC